MDQQQLQIARAALWHQTATEPSTALRTLDDAASWLEETGFCLFLPRHAQLPAPAPSLVEACLGKASALPAQGAIEEAAALMVRLVGEGRAIPLNLLGNFSEQPDFLVTPEILPWVAAVRGDRQWKTAPGGRTTPIVVRSFEALDREGELTAIGLREILGNEITEAAALRALMELWTGLRAIPIYVQGEATRWTLLKNRFATQMATAANTAQTTALSALASLYLRSAVAATAEEAEVFLSPLTARSRIREVLHGMMATRQLGTTTVASQTLLFVEGSLPETEAPAPQAEPAQGEPGAETAPSRPTFRKGPRPARVEFPKREARPQGEASRPWQKKPAAAYRGRPGGERPRREGQGSEDRRPRSGEGFAARAGGPRRPEEPGAKPWRPQRKDSFREKAFGNRKFVPRDREASAEPPAGETGPPREQRWSGRKTGPGGFRKDQRSQGAGQRPWQKKPAFRDERPARAAEGGEEKRPWQKRPSGPGGFRKDRKPGEGQRPWQKKPAFRGERPARAAEGGEEKRPWQKRPSGPGGFRKDRKPGAGQKPWQKKPAFRAERPQRAGEGGKQKRPWQKRPSGPGGFRKDRKPGAGQGAWQKKPAFRAERPERAGEGGEERRPWKNRPSGPGGLSKDRKPGEGAGQRARGKRPEGSAKGGEGRAGRPFRPTGSGKPFRGKEGRPGGRDARPGRSFPAKNKFRKASPAERKPRKNRNQEETPE